MTIHKNPYIPVLLILFIVTLLLTCCRDEMIVPPDPGEGEGDVVCDVLFEPMASALQTRADGGAIGAIENLTVLVYDMKGALVKAYGQEELKDYKVDMKGNTDFPDIDGSGEHYTPTQAEAATARATFTIPSLAFGRYRIYAVANVPLTDNEKANIDSIRNKTVEWNPEEIGANSAMFGYFTNVKNGAAEGSEGFEAPPVVVGKNYLQLHAWIKRCASKLTVAFNGAGLHDGVNIYVKSVTLHDIPKSCRLGVENTPAEQDQLYNDYTATPQDAVANSVMYYTSAYQYGAESGTHENPGADYTKWLTVANTVGPNNDGLVGSDHSEKANALYFFENNQGDYEGQDEYDKRQQWKDVGSNITAPGQKDFKDNVRWGTYVEVEAYYVSTNPENKSNGKIIYRFMLGKNITYNYNSSRNHHFKLTLGFRGWANQPDWHIEYQEQILEVSEPLVMDYRGKVFVPEIIADSAVYNQGHEFTDNSVLVKSYSKDGDNTPEAWTMEFDENGDGQYSDKCSWITPEITDGESPGEKKVTFKITPNKQEYDIDERLKLAIDKGTEELPYNLANRGELVEPKKATIKNTANCYIVDAPGYYILPLVYGNAYLNSQKNDKAYKYQGTYTGDQILKTFKDYLGNEITSPFIQDTNKPEYTPKSAFLVWQDENDLVSYTVHNPTADIKYLPEAYGGKGGIMFRIERGNIKQGNAVIGIGTKEKTVGTIDLPPVMWSWHIWVTNFGFLKDEDKTIEVTTHDPGVKCKFIPVNLGWCSGHGEKVNYYPARKCKVRIKAGLKEKIIELEQKSHIAVSRGNSLYYQWGRKDPFVGATANSSLNGNKTRYYSVDWSDVTNPAMLSADTTASQNRYTSRGAIDKGLLIQNPRLWHNPRRKKNEGPDGKPLEPNGYPFLSDNEIYRNLWEGRLEITPGSPSLKTVYDPCPVGYQVPHANAATGFTTFGGPTNESYAMYDVQLFNIDGYDPVTGQCGPNGIYSKGLYEFYTDPAKLQSIIFPESGYRDWDDYANAYQANIDAPIGYIWLAGNMNGNDNRSYNFEFARKDWAGKNYIRPFNDFYPCDGFPIRPCIYDYSGAL